MLPVACAVLIVGFHAYDPLERCLRSLNPYLSEGDEVVVVDHESDSARLARALAACPRAVGISRPDNRGFAAGINLAAARSTATHLMWLNPDAELLGPVPRTLSAFLDANPGVGVVGPRVLNADDTVQSSARRFPGLSTVLGGRSTWLTQRFPNNWFTAYNMFGRDNAEPLEVDWLAGSCVMTPRAVFDDLGGLDESFFLYWEDADYLLARARSRPAIGLRAHRRCAPLGRRELSVSQRSRDS